MRRLVWRRTLARFGCARSGTAAVEFAIILPLLLVSLFGMTDIGRVLVDFHAASKSVRDATRYLSRVGLTCTAGTSSGPLANYIDSAADETAAINLAMTGSIDSPTATSDYLLGYWTTTSTIATTVNCVVNGSQYAGVYAGDPTVPVITMIANIPFNFLWGSMFVGSAGVTLTIRHSEVHVGE